MPVTARGDFELSHPYCRAEVHPLQHQLLTYRMSDYGRNEIM